VGLNPKGRGIADMPRKVPLRQLRTPTLYTFGEAELLDLDDRSAHVLRM